MSTRKVIGYHLFFHPQGELFDSLQNIISGLAQKHGGRKFEPHVTLLHRIPPNNEADIIAKTRQLASKMEPFEIHPKEIQTEDSYFRALYCKAEPNPKLDEYHQKALEAFDMQDADVYIPHLSLLYGNLPQPVKDDIIAALLLPEIKFLADKIYLYRIEGETQDWVRLESYLLGK